MGNHIERITSHAVWQEMETLGNLIDKVVSLNQLDPEIVDDVERVRTVLAYCGKRLASTDPALLLPVTLDTINTMLNQIRTELELFINNRNTSHINTVNLRTDELIAPLRNIPSPTIDQLTFVNESISSYRNNLKKYLKDISEDQKKVETELKNNTDLLNRQREIIEAEQQKLSSMLTTFQSQFSSDQDKRASEFAAALDALRSKVNEAINENKTQFSDNQILNSKKISEIIESNTNELDALLTSFGSIHEEAKEEYREILQGLKEKYEDLFTEAESEIEDNKIKVEKLVGVIGNLGVTSGYLKAADHARVALYVWQSLTVAALIGLIIVAFKMAFPSEDELTLRAAVNLGKDTDIVFYQGLAVRIFLSITFGVFAAYSASQADKQYRIERKNRKLALELEALGAFISPLPEEMQHKFRADIGERSFGIPDTDNVANNSDPVSFMHLIKSKEFDEVLSRIAKIFKGDD